VVRTSEVLDVEMTAQFLTVSSDTAFDLFKSGELPGRKWIMTRGAVLRWIESSSEEQTLARAIGRGDQRALKTPGCLRNQDASRVCLHRQRGRIASPIVEAVQLELQDFGKLLYQKVRWRVPSPAESAV
jgi:hypothetical protein